MRILALDTSSHACSVALVSDTESRSRHEIIPLQHAKALLPYLEEILASDLKQVDALAWGCGPGSFTGLRIAASVIQALGFAQDLPVISVSSLAALAQSAYRQHGWKQLLTAVDARMGEVYWAAYTVSEAGYAELKGEESRCAPTQVPLDPSLDPKNCYGVGDAWGPYSQELTQGLGSPPLEQDKLCLPQALAIAELARLKVAKGEWQAAKDVLPRYLSDKVV